MFALLTGLNSPLAFPQSIGAAEAQRRSAAANDGNEAVPTVVVAGRPYVNPDPEWVREQLRSQGTRHV
jgi:mycoredoxin